MSLWVVDTCVILDLVAGSPDQTVAAESVLDRAGAVAVCPVSVVELGPTFPDGGKLRDFFLDYGIEAHHPFTELDADVGRDAWHRIIRQRRLTGSSRRPIADILIGAFAVGRAGVVSRQVV